MPNSIVKHCLQHLAFTMWRRKTWVIVSLIIVSLVVIHFQYHSVESQNTFDGQNGIPNKDFPLGMTGPKSNGHNTLIPRRNLSGLGQLATPVMYRDERNPAAVKSHLSVGVNVQNDAVVGQNEKVGPWHRFSRDENWSAGGQDRQILGRNSQQYVPQYRVVHFDLKGAPPKMSYYKQIFPILKEAGANAILMEYEDMFPFLGKLASIAAENHYSKEDIRYFLGLCKEYGFEVIPLVQTFGHLEFALKIKDFRDMREVDEFPQALCPSNNDSVPFVYQIIDQVMAEHKDVKWLHIGCDEVFQLGHCRKCMYQDRDNLFLSHVAKIATYVRNKYKVVPIIWDDMLRQMTTEKLKEFNIGKLVEPMVWTYVKDVYRFIPYNVWMMFSEVFPNIWAASAFKGAFGETLTVPNIKMHLENNEAWLEVMAEQHKKFQNFYGIVITGWQRYDHFATLCELFPAGFPSLILNLLTVTNGQFNQQIFTKLRQFLKCSNNPYVTNRQVDLDSDPYLWERLSGCFFPGSPVFRLAQHHSEVIKRVNDYLYDVTIHKAWLTDYNVRHNLSSPWRVDEGLTDYSSVYYPVTSLVRAARDALREVYDEFTVAEWIEQNVYPYILKMEKLWKDSGNLKKARIWPRRPLPPLEDLKRFSVGFLDGKGDET